MEFENKNCIVNFSNSILKHYGVDTFHSTIPEIDEVLKGHKKVVVMLFDGLGEIIQDKNKECCPNIINHRIHSMKATFPPTTVASTVGFLSGKFPIENGWMSWVQYIPEYKRNIEVFRNKDYVTRELIEPRDNLILDKYCPRTSIIELINSVKGKKVAYDMDYFYGEYYGPSVLTIARWKLNKLFKKQKDELFMYYYFERPDHDMHIYGTTHKKVKWIIKRIDRFTKKIAKRNPDTLFLVVADHGQVDTEYLNLHEHEDLLATLLENNPLSFEKRSQTFFVKDEQKETFKKLFQEYYGDKFDLYSREEVLKKNIYGEGAAHPMVAHFLGDYLAISKGPWAFLHPQVENPFILKGSHAGGTIDEMNIAVSAFNK